MVGVVGVCGSELCTHGCCGCWDGKGMEEGEFRFSWGRLPVGEVGEYGLGAPPVMVELLSRMLSRGRAWSALVGVVLERGEGERGE